MGLDFLAPAISSSSILIFCKEQLTNGKLWINLNRKDIQQCLDLIIHIISDTKKRQQIRRIQNREWRRRWTVQWMKLLIHSMNHLHIICFYIHLIRVSVTIETKFCYYTCVGWNRIMLQTRLCYSVFMNSQLTELSRTGFHIYTFQCKMLQCKHKYNYT